jgi:hypothetical protein
MTYNCQMIRSKLNILFRFQLSYMTFMKIYFIALLN